MQVVLRGVRLDIPRHSWSQDFYSLRCPEVRVTLPASAAHAAAAAEPQPDRKAGVPQERPGFGEVAHVDEVDAAWQGAASAAAPAGAFTTERGCKKEQTDSERSHVLACWTIQA